ncbi:MAG: hypothetical protein ACRYFU_10185 [Janthinobacterium lividum]
MANSDALIIVAADVMRGDVLIHFSDGSSVLFRSSYLNANRNQDGNEPIPDKLVTEDEPFILPDEEQSS